MYRTLLALVVVLVCGCQTTKQPPRRDAEINVDVPVGEPEKAKLTATVRVSF